jgi:hypothetical protein
MLIIGAISLEKDFFYDLIKKFINDTFILGFSASLSFPLNIPT